jgi:hypothetical protein
MITLLVLLGIVLISAGAYGGYYFSKMQEASDEGTSTEEESQTEEDFDAEEVEEEETSEEEDEDEEEENSLSSEYLGTHIEAQLPEGWQIIEYENGAGSDMLMSETDYTGLTGLSILTDDDEEVFQLYAVMGIGGIDICSNVAKFTDTPQSYIDEVNDLTVEYNNSVLDPEPMPVVTQIADGGYTEFELIDFRGRRVGTDLYWNDLDNESLDEFHPLCGLAASVLSFETLTFDYDSGYGADVGTSYGVKVVGEPDEADLILLDSVMSSIVLK